MRPGGGAPLPGQMRHGPLCAAAEACGAADGDGVSCAAMGAADGDGAASDAKVRLSSAASVSASGTPVKVSV